MPMFPDKSKMSDVPARVLVPEKYAIWPVVPVYSEEVAIERDCAVLFRVVSVPERPRPRVAEVVATDCRAPEPAPYIREPEVKEDCPVPPRETASCPVHPRVRFCAEMVPVTFVSFVTP
jgi:hypothetical protein